MAARLAAPAYYAPRFSDAERDAVAEETRQARDMIGYE
jgi:hypothetical protein